MSLRTTLGRLRPLALRLDPALYVLWAAACTLASAHVFYGYMLKQTGGEWSAPLDDVFIHFDFARATARGHPFQWDEGNGYSSGNTSLLYPFVLALGYVLGFRQLRLMVWAAVVAGVCVLATLLAARRLFVLHERHGQHDLAARALSYLAPPMFLAVGALDWSLWSGMEVALFLATWALALLAFVHLDHARGQRRVGAAWVLGLCGAILVLTRPESVTTIAAFGLAAALGKHARLARAPGRTALGELVRIGWPAAMVVVVQSIANRLLTAEWSANGALVKLAINNPYLTPAEKYGDWLFNLKYGVLRNVEYHFTDAFGFGVILPALACAALAAPRTRRIAAVVWAQIVGWMLLVALNGQVRWQNERYVMPPVAWLLLLAALGVSAVVRRDAKARPTFLATVILGAYLVQLWGVATRPAGVDPVMRLAWPLALGIGAAAALALRYWPVRVVAALGALVFAQVHLESKMRDQKWFFGRASRNIRDQHVTTGRMLKEGFPIETEDGRTVRYHPRRVLVGDAGAILYAADMPGLDIIGLGGFHSFPFARAGVHGLASTIELMEYVPPADRPDVMAIYPSWWGVLPTWFASRELARIPAEGNVICGGYEDVVYAADWSLLGTGEDPREAPQGEAVRDAVDVADVLSERRHSYVFPHPAGGWTEMKILADPSPAAGTTAGGLLDGGRRIASAKEERFVLRRLAPRARAHLVIRSAPEGASHVRVLVEGVEVGRFDLAATEAWVETVIELPPSAVTGEMRVTLANDGPADFVDYHAWATQ